MEMERRKLSMALSTEEISITMIEKMERVRSTMVNGEMQFSLMIWAMF